MKFSGKLGNGPKNKRLHFGGDPLQGSGSMDPYRDTGETCLGGGMHCLSVSSFPTENTFCDVCHRPTLSTLACVMSNCGAVVMQDEADDNATDSRCICS